MSAPARLKPVRVSSTTRRSSIQPSRGGGLDHRVLARDVVGGHRHAEPLLDPADDVEVGQGRLDHDHVGPFGQVERHLADRLVAVGRVHLVRPAVAERRGALGGVAEGAVIAAGELGGVGQDRQVREPAPSSPARIAATMPSIIPDGATTSAPARAWLTACSARSGSVASLSTSTRPPALGQGAAVAVVGVLAEADVGDDQQAGRLPS